MKLWWVYMATDKVSARPADALESSVSLQANKMNTWRKLDAAQRSDGKRLK